MATATFSNSASLAGALYAPPAFDGGPTIKNFLLPDQSATANYAIANQGAMNLCMQTGEPFLAKGPDGALHWYRFVHGSTPASPVIAFMGP